MEAHFGVNLTHDVAQFRAALQKLVDFPNLGQDSVGLLAERLPLWTAGSRTTTRILPRSRCKDGAGRRREDTAGSGPTKQLSRRSVTGAPSHFEATHPIGSRARLAFGLLLYTTQRRADIVQMGRQHIRDGALHVTQSKTGTALEIPVHEDLQRLLDATPSGHLTFLTTSFGKPFTPLGFTNWFRDMCNEAGLPRGTSAHGLRKAACRRLAEAGCSANVIRAISGHKSLREVDGYTQAAERKLLAQRGVRALGRPTETRTENLQTQPTKLTNIG